MLLDLKEDVRTECEKFGEVTNVILYDVSLTFSFGLCGIASLTVKTVDSLKKMA